MASGIQENSLGLDNDHAFNDQWYWESVSSSDEALGVVEFVIDRMARESYPAADLFAVRVALQEAILNAVAHGNRNDPTRLVRVSYHVDAGRVVITVEDEGEGFDPGRLPDPLAPENLERLHGRGLLLMRSFLTSVRHNERGNRVTLCKERSRA
jgi:serine/threonine-protein kinase RsbW